MNTETIKMILNIAPWFFVVIILLFAIFGLIKGVYKSACGMIVQGIILIVVTAISPSVANLIGNFNLTTYITQPTISVGNTSLHVSSIRMMVCEYITSTGMVSPVNGQAIYEAAMSLTNILLSFAVFIVLAIVFGLLGWILSTLIYHTIVKWFINKKTRMKNKHRILGMTTGAAMGFFSAWMMIAPFSYLSHTVSQNKEALTSLKKSTDDNIDQYIDWALLFGDSNFSQDWIYNPSEYIINFATNNNYLDSTANFSSLTSLIAGISGSAALGLSGDNNTAFDYTLIVGDKAAVQTIIDALVKSNVIMKVMPSIMEAAVNYVNNPSTIDLSKLDFTDMDFSNELNMLKSVYESLFDAGLVTSLIKNESYTIDDSNKENYLSALKTFGNDAFVSKNLSILMQQAAEYLKDMSGFEILSTDASSYAVKSDASPDGIEWANELSNLGEIVFSLSDTLDVPLNMDSLSNIQDKFIQGLQDDDKFKQIRKVLVGSDDYVGKGLLDTFIFQDNIFNAEEAVDYVFTYYPVLKTYMNQEEISDKFEKATWSQVKEELTNIIDLYPDVSELYDLGKDDSGKFNFDLSNNELLNKSKEILTSLKKLNLLKDLIPGVIYSSLPSILKNTFGSESVFGLNTYSFNFTDADVILDGAGDFLDIIPAINDLLDVMNNNDGGITTLINKINTNDLKNILTTFIDSKMLNPDRIVDGETVSNSNINTILTNILDNIGLEDYGLEIIADTSSVVWKQIKDGVITYPEVDSLIAVFEDLKTYKDVLGDDGSFKLDSLSGSDLKVIVGDLSDSELFGDSIGPMMDKQIKPILDGLSIEISLNKKREEWKKAVDGSGNTALDYLGSMFDLMKPFMNSKSLEYKKLSGDYINALLTTLINSTFLGEDYENVMANFMGSILDSTFQATEKLGYDASLICQSNGHTDGNRFIWVGTCSVPEEGFYLYRDESSEGQQKFENIAIDTTGEVSRICAAFETLVPMSDNLTSGAFESDELKIVLNALHSSIILKRLTPSILRIAMDTASQGLEDAIDLTLLDFDSFIALDDDDYNSEVDHIIDIYKYSKDGTLLDIFQNINEITGNSKATDSEGNFRSRKDVLGEILSYVNTMTVTTGVRKDKNLSLRADVYMAIFKDADISQTYGGITIGVTFSMFCFYTYNQIATLATNYDVDTYNEYNATADKLMLNRIFEVEAKENSGELFDADVEPLLDLLENKDTYIAGGTADMSSILNLEDSNLLVGSGEFLMTLVTIASMSI